MNTADPIRDPKLITKMRKHLQDRDRLLFILGINSGLRISDMLKLTVADVLGKDAVYLREKKTGKEKKFPINKTIQKALKEYFGNKVPSPDTMLFASREGENRAITRQTAHTILSTAGEDCNIPGIISCHTLRKTFGYHAYRQGISIGLLKEIFNHSSEAITMRYIGITQDEIDKVFIDLELE